MFPRLRRAKDPALIKQKSRNFSAPAAGKRTPALIEKKGWIILPYQIKFKEHCQIDLNTKSNISNLILNQICSSCQKINFFHAYCAILCTRARKSFGTFPVYTMLFCVHARGKNWYFFSYNLNRPNKHWILAFRQSRLQL